MSLGIALRAFFGAIFSRATAQRIRAALEQVPNSSLAEQSLPQTQSTLCKAEETSKGPHALGQKNRQESVSAAKSVGKRSEAITLLSTLQREARLLDLICEPLDQFSDAQIGAAAREVLKDSRQTLDRLFSIAPLADLEEGDSLKLEATQSAARIRLLGKSHGTHGVIVHRGWKASKCELPQWQGDVQDALVLMPIEVEVS